MAKKDPKELPVEEKLKALFFGALQQAVGLCCKQP